MKTYDLHDNQGRLFAFEIPNIGRAALCDLLGSFPDTTLERRPCFLSEFREEEFCEFSFSGQTFRAWEPFGDNSRFWIGPEPAEYCEQTSRLQALFSAQADMPLFGRLRSLFHRLRLPPISNPEKG